MRKIRNCRRGMTLTETLVALAIVTLIGAAMTLGINSAIQIYRDATALSEAEVLSGSIMTVLEHEIRYSTNLGAEIFDDSAEDSGEGDSGGSPGDSSSSFQFDSHTYGSSVKVSTTEDGRIQIGGQNILPESAYTRGLKAEAELKEDNNGYVMITVKIFLPANDSDSPNGDKVLSQHSVTVLPINH